MATGYSPQIATDGLVLYVDAHNPKSYPGSGTSWYDLTGNGYNFNTNTAPTFTTGVNGVSCFDFTNGNGEYFDSVKLSPFSGNSFAISVIAVVNQNSVGSYHGILTQHEQDGFDSMAFMSYNGKFGTDHWSPGGRRLSTAANTNQVYMVAWTIPTWSQHQTTAQQIYLDGQAQTTEVYSVDTVGSLVQDYFRIGNWQLSRSDMDFNGQIYSVMCYDRALSAAEVQANYNAIKGRFGI